jgi:integrase
MAADPKRNGKRRQFIETFDTKTKALDRQTDILGDIKKGVHSPRSTSLTLSAAATAWLAQAETDGLERSTRREYERYVAKEIIPRLGNEKLANLTVASVKKFRNDLSRSRYSRAMQKKIVGSLGAILADAQSSGAVGQNVVHAEAVQNQPAARRRRLAEKRQEKPIVEGVDYPTKAELRALLAVDSPRYGVLLKFTVATGLRASELRGLEWRHLDLEVGIVKVEQRADRWNNINVPKSSAGRREIPLSPEIVLLLKEWRLRCPRCAGKLTYVFPNGEGNLEYLPNWHNRVLVQLHRAAGISNPEAKGPRYGMHSFRHVAISLWIEDGMSPKEVQTLAGHSTIQMTFDVYGHLWRANRDDSTRMSGIWNRLLG